MELCLGMGLSTAGKPFQICEDSADLGRMPERVDLSGGVVTELELGVSVYMQQGFGGKQ